MKKFYKELDTDVIRNALNAHESVIETPLDNVTVMALKELLEYREAMIDTAGNKRHGQDVFREVQAG